MTNRGGRTRVGALILAVWLLGIVFVSLWSPRIRPPGGLTRVDHVLLCLLPVGSFVAAGYCRSKLLHLIYGVVGAQLFLGPYLDAVGLLQFPWPSSIRAFTLRWTALTIFMGFLCRSLVFLRPPPRVPEGACVTCGYDLTGNVSGVCPECGRKITS